MPRRSTVGAGDAAPWRANQGVRIDEQPQPCTARTELPSRAQADLVIFRSPRLGDRRQRKALKTGCESMARTEITKRLSALVNQS